MSSVNDIQGRNCLFQLKQGDVYMDVMCAKTFSISVNTDMKETTTKGSGFWKEYRPRKLSYTMTFNGVVQVVAEEDKPTVKTMLDSQMAFLPLNYRLIYRDNSDNVLVLEGTVYVTNTTIDSNPINLLNGTTQLQGTGPVVPSDVVPVYVLLTVQVTSIEANGKIRFILSDSDGNTVFDSSLLDATQANNGWLMPIQTVTAQLIAGTYYYSFVAEDVNSDDNILEIDTPLPVDFPFTHVNAAYNSHPQFYDFTAPRTAVFSFGAELPPPVCEDVTINGTPSLPDGHVGTPYNYVIGLSGSEPFVLHINQRPVWMSITILGSNVFFSGIPTELVDDLVVDIDITNCSSGEVNFTDTFDITTQKVAWGFEIDELSGSLVIEKNFSEVVNEGVTASGEFPVVDSDNIFTTVTGSFGTTRHLKITNTSTGTVLTDQSNTGNLTYDLTVTGQDSYLIEASVT